MTVLFLFPRFGIGGIAKALSFVVNACAAAGMETLCVSMSNEPIMIDLPDTSVKQYIRYLEQGNAVRRLANKATVLMHLRSLIRSNNPDVMVAFGTDHVRILTLASIGLKTPIIGSERGNPYSYTRRQKRKYCLALERCARVVFQTEQAKLAFPERIRDNSVIIPNPCVGKGSIAPNVLNDGKCKILLTYSRISREKNVDGIMDAFSLAEEQIKELQPDWSLSLHIHGDGPEKAALMEKAEREGLDSVSFFPSCPDVLGQEPHVDAFILNSLTEGFPNSLIESMQKGIPCIASDSPPGGVRFITDGGRRACLVPVGDNGALAAAMVRILTDTDYRAGLLRAAVELQTVLNPEKIAGEWVRLIYEVTGACTDQKSISGDPS